MATFSTQTIGSIVAQDYRTATVFTKYKIDFCCKGGRTIEEACQAKNISSEEVEQAVEALLNETFSADTDYNSWPLDKLISHIEEKHHRYVEERLPVLKAYLDKLCSVHGERHPELFEINQLFTGSAADLSAHMKKEEMVLFPFVRQMVKAKKFDSLPASPHFGTVENPVRMMMHEHDNEGERFRKIAALSNNYTPPADACNTFKVTYALLQEFEEDLHLHIHLENNILFPKSLEMEKEFNEQN